MFLTLLMPTCFVVTLHFLMYYIYKICFCHQKGGLSYLTDESPDVLCIQETKCATEDIPGDVKVDGYHDYWSSAEKAGYAGTAIYSKTKPLNVTYGLGMKAGSSWGISRDIFKNLYSLFSLDSVSVTVEYYLCNKISLMLFCTIK